MKKQGFAKIRAAMKGKGFIVALALSVAAVGFSTYYAYNSVMSGFGGEDSDELFMEVDKNQPGIPLVTTAPPAAPAAAATSAPAASTPADTSTEPQTEPANNFFTAASPRILPVEGEIIGEYSDGELVKSQTLNLWQTHDGVDIAAEIGTDVRACGEGTVSDIREDALWGVCVSIDHGDGSISSVCGLDINVPVAIGQEIACGDIIGKAGNTAECECSLAPHIHFEVKKDGSYISPLTFING
ncbi:MAG: M23 family metallopeptidase [Bacteroides sp.]|nr:M23 family metallopeptidase [Bacteroides sp.]